MRGEVLSKEDIVHKWGVEENYTSAKRAVPETAENCWVTFSLPEMFQVTCTTPRALHCLWTTSVTLVPAPTTAERDSGEKPTIPAARLLARITTSINPPPPGAITAPPTGLTSVKRTFLFREGLPSLRIDMRNLCDVIPSENTRTAPVATIQRRKVCSKDGGVTKRAISALVAPSPSYLYSPHPVEQFRCMQTSQLPRSQWFRLGAALSAQWQGSGPLAQRLCAPRCSPPDRTCRRGHRGPVWFPWPW